MFVKDFSIRIVRFLMPCLLALVLFFSYQLLRGDHWQAAFAAFDDGFQYASLTYSDPDTNVVDKEKRGDLPSFGNRNLSGKRYAYNQLRRDMDYLLAMKGDHVQALFDRPELVRSELPTIIWQYRDEHCVLDIYFSVKNSDDVAQAEVMHYELRPRNRRAIQGVTPSRCVKSLAYQDNPLSILNVGAIYKASLE